MSLSTDPTSRLLDLLRQKHSRPAVLPLSHSTLRRIEQTTLLSHSEKIEILLVSLGYKLTTEIGQQITYHWSSTRQLEVPILNVRKIETLLRTLPFPFFRTQTIKLNRRSQQMKKFIWFHLSVNTQVAYFLKKYGPTLSDVDDGLLYGYPPSAVRAYHGLIDRKIIEPKSAYQYFLAGVYSKQFYREELEYYKRQWGLLKKISPRIIQEAEDYFIKNYRP